MLTKKQKGKTLRKKYKIMTRTKCFICHQNEDPDGRCRCVNKDAW